MYSLVKKSLLTASLFLSATSAHAQLFESDFFERPLLVICRDGRTEIISVVGGFSGDFSACLLFCAQSDSYPDVCEDGTVIEPPPPPKGLPERKSPITLPEIPPPPAKR